jgi:hypothetical protein
MADDVIVINNPPGLESRTSKSGKQRFHIKVVAEPLVFSLDEKKIVQPLAEAFAHHIREKIRSITAQAAPATIKAREVARRALLKGEAWAVKRYGGGKMGTRMPAQSNNLFNDSGRMIESIVAQAAKDGTFRVNVAANRLNPETLNGGEAALQRIWARLVQLVPEIQDVGRAMQSDAMMRARAKAVQGMITKLRADSAEKVLRLIKTVADVGSNFADLGRSVAG